MARSLVVAAVVVSTGVVLGAAPANAAGATLYVAESGSDAGDCTSAAAPCATVTYALTKAAAGVVVKVSGTIHDHIALANTLSPVTITGAGAASPAVLDGSGGGSVIDSQATLTLDRLTIQNGSANYGGGVDNGGDLTITRSTVKGNSAVSGGGGIANWYGTVHISDSAITGNTAGMGGGGGLYTGYGAVTIVRSSITGNQSPDGHGGGLNAVTTDRTMTISDSTVSGNSSTYGAGISGGPMVITNTTVAGNTAIFAGGIWLMLDSALLLTSSTVAGNTATYGGIYAYGTVTMGGSILGPNTTGDCTVNGGQFVSVGYNIASDASCNLTATGDLPSTNAQLGPLQDNGGPARTMMPAADGPAADRIPASTALNNVAACPRADQRGVPGPISGATKCAIGAVEPGTLLTQSPLLVTSASGTFGQPLTLTTSGGSGSGTVTFDASDGTATGCAVSATAPYTLTSSTVGTCVVTATQAGDATYWPVSSVPTTVTIAPIEVNAAAPVRRDGCGTAADEYVIPATTGVQYQVGGAAKAAGSYPGTGTVNVTAVAESGYTLSGTTTWSMTFSTSGCAASVSAPELSTPGSTSPRVPVSWSVSGVPAGSGTVRFDVQRRTVGVSARGVRVYSTPVAWLTHTTARSATFTGSAGAVYQFRTRAIDGLGNVTAWSGWRTSVMVTDERAGSVGYGGRWRAVASASYYAGTYKTTSAAGAYAQVTAWTDKVTVVGAKSPTTGKVAVYVDGVLKGKVDTYRVSTALRQTWITLSLRYGRHVIRVVDLATAGRPSVRLDGFAFRR